MEQHAERDHLLPVERELCERVRWFVSLRWVAGGVVVLLGALLRWGLGWQVPLGVEVVGAAVLLYNLPCWWLVHQLEPHPLRQWAWNRVANLQVGLDLVLLTVLLHFTGGLFSPLLPYAVFHIMIASLLLRRRDVFLQAGLAILLVGGLGWLEWSGRLPPATLGGRLPDASAMPLSTIVLILLGFAALLTITAYLASTIGYALRRRERELMRTRQDLQEAYQQLEDVDRAKTQFTRMVTHELRSPVAALQSMLEVLRRGYTGELPARSAAVVERATRRTEVLLELVSQLLDLAREKAQLVPRRDEMVPVAVLFEEVDEAYRTQSESKGVRFDLELPAGGVVARGDPDELGKLLSNLVSNAVKYTPEGGRVILRACREDDQVVLEVGDTGIGIPEAEQGQLFTEFFRASNARKVAEHGTGLGLTIVKRITEAHGGRLDFCSEEGKGTAFTIHLPAALEDQGAESGDQKQPAIDLQESPTGSTSDD